MWVHSTNTCIFFNYRFCFRNNTFLACVGVLIRQKHLARRSRTNNQKLLSTKLLGAIHWLLDVSTVPLFSLQISPSCVVPSTNTRTHSDAFHSFCFFVSLYYDFYVFVYVLLFLSSVRYFVFHFFSAGTLSPSRFLLLTLLRLETL